MKDFYEFCSLYKINAEMKDDHIIIPMDFDAIVIPVRLIDRVDVTSGNICMTSSNVDDVRKFCSSIENRFDSIRVVYFAHRMKSQGRIGFWYHFFKKGNRRNMSDHPIICLFSDRENDLWNDRVEDEDIRKVTRFIMDWHRLVLNEEDAM